MDEISIFVKQGGNFADNEEIKNQIYEKDLTIQIFDAKGNKVTIKNPEAPTYVIPFSPVSNKTVELYTTKHKKFT